jgi:hypothetical protein
MSLFSSVLNAFAGDKAAKTQERAANAANDLVRQQYEQTRSDLGPYREAGTSALGRYRDLLGFNGRGAAQSALAGYTESPFLPQLRQRTIDAVDNSRAARGMLNSGGTLGEIGDRVGQLYLGDYNNYLSRIGGMIDSGQNSAAQTGTFGANAAATRAGLTQDAGAYKAQQAIIPAMEWNRFETASGDALGGGLLKRATGGAFG